MKQANNNCHDEIDEIRYEERENRFRQSSESTLFPNDSSNERFIENGVLGTCSSELWDSESIASSATDNQHVNETTALLSER